MLDIYVDADACPVKQEVYRVAQRLGLNVIVVANTYLQTPRDDDSIRCVAVGEGMDVADDWIAEHIGQDDICITADVPLAARCLDAGAQALGPRGKAFTEDSIGEVLATRDLLSSLRETGQVGGGPAPMTQKDRSQFLNRLDQVIQALKNKIR